MSLERLAFDSNAAIDLLRPDRPTPPPFHHASALIMPLFVLAELRLGFYKSGYEEKLDELVALTIVVAPDQATITHYVAVRKAMLHARTIPTRPEAQRGLGHDLWIAALCVQHRVPLLTNDSDFDGIESLTVIRW